MFSQALTLYENRQYKKSLRKLRQGGGNTGTTGGGASATTAAALLESILLAELGKPHSHPESLLNINNKSDKSDLLFTYYLLAAGPPGPAVAADDAGAGKAGTAETDVSVAVAAAGPGGPAYLHGDCQKAVATLDKVEVIMGKEDYEGRQCRRFREHIAHSHGWRHGSETKKHPAKEHPAEKQSAIHKKDNESDNESDMVSDLEQSGMASAHSHGWRHGTGLLEQGEEELVQYLSYYISRKVFVYPLVKHLRSGVMDLAVRRLALMEPSPAVDPYLAHFLALYHKDLPLIEEAIAWTPTLPDLYVVRARLLKGRARQSNTTSASQSDLASAAAAIDTARHLDLSDRWLNQKCVKYYLLSGNTPEAKRVMSCFQKWEMVKELQMVRTILDFSEAAKSSAPEAAAKAAAEQQHHPSASEAAAKAAAEQQHHPSASEAAAKAAAEQQHHPSASEAAAFAAAEQQVGTTQSTPQGTPQDAHQGTAPSSSPSAAADGNEAKQSALPSAAADANAVVSIFSSWLSDIFDFHLYCMRRTPLEYLYLMRWARNLYSSPIFVRAMNGADSATLQSLHKELVDPSSLGQEDNEKSLQTVMPQTSSVTNVAKWDISRKSVRLTNSAPEFTA
ncbi:hypothetical protein KGF56_003948 [Candida oxycetoniae]|uniref:Uncharacterized protein n=1 Tax=Candida oxycetoniae TaxID=497107 RepID=A0AAI9SVN6_9ASCO|nr:uncharacterized protein KGF56_003948 [Candida oxycetoniae]KAI3403360.2 hypothetical protein KGF56_003948 [Candida oxycetoniae]